HRRCRRAREALRQRSGAQVRERRPRHGRRRPEGARGRALTDLERDADETLLEGIPCALPVDLEPLIARRRGRAWERELESCPLVPGVRTHWGDSARDDVLRYVAQPPPHGLFRCAREAGDGEPGQRWCAGYRRVDRDRTADRARVATHVELDPIRVTQRGDAPRAEIVERELVRRLA